MGIPTESGAQSGAMVSGRTHSKAVKIAATVLARLAGKQAASDAFGIDRRTIRGWVKHEDVPADSWAALDELAGAQLLERVARGQVTNPTTLATARGIASRNRRNAELMARREEAEQPAPINSLGRLENGQLVESDIRSRRGFDLICRLLPGRLDLLLARPHVLLGVPEADADGLALGAVHQQQLALESGAVLKHRKNPLPEGTNALVHLVRRAMHRYVACIHAATSSCSNRVSVDKGSRPDGELTVNRCWGVVREE